MIDIFGVDNKVVMIDYYQGTNKKAGSVVKANATHVWNLNDGKLTIFFQAVDRATINS